MNQATTDLELIRRRLLGRGVRCERIDPTLDFGRDLVLRRSADGLDLAMVENVENLNQCLEIGLTTLLGSDVFNTEFGFDGLNALVDETNPILMRERVRISLIKLLQKDSRIRRILDLKLLDGRLARHVPPGTANADDDPVDRWRTLRADVAFETVGGDTAVLNIGKVLTHA